MLQFIAKPNQRYSLPELAQMAIEGGCQWVRLRLEDMPDEEIRELAAELIPLCKETQTILTIEDHIEMAKELALHGVHLRHERKAPLEVREILGPEAIIGVEIKTAVTAINLKGKDIDYVSFEVDPQKDGALDALKNKISAARGAGVEMPIVAEGPITEASLPAVMACKPSGIALYGAIADANDPVDATAQLLGQLKP